MSFFDKIENFKYVNSYYSSIEEEEAMKCLLRVSLQSVPVHSTRMCLTFSGH